MMKATLPMMNPMEFLNKNQLRMMERRKTIIMEKTRRLLVMITIIPKLRQWLTTLMMQTSNDPMSTELPKKQKFKNLDKALDQDNYVDLPAQRKRTFKHADAENTMNINWKTIPSQQ